MLNFLRALFAPLNTQAVALASVALALTSGTALVHELTDANFLLALFACARHNGQPQTIAQLVAPLIGILLGLIGAYLGRPATIPSSPPPTEPAGQDVPLKTAA